MTRAVTHIHTHRSWDSRLTPERLGEDLAALGVGLALVADHNTFEGALEFARHCADHRRPILVPVAAEVRTDEGDALVVFEPGTSPPPIDDLLAWTQMVPIVRELGGLVGLPHPFRGHRDPERLAADVDFIEVFNARCTDTQNEKAARLCERLGLFRTYGSDTHRRHELPRVIVEYPTQPTVLAMIGQHASCESPSSSPKSDWMAAEITNGIKRRRPLLAGYYVARYLKHKGLETIGKPWPR